MKPIRLYIDNFMCHDKSFIDFTQFSAALIVGNKEQNDLRANGVGKSTIFKAIEYVLFNQSDVNLERIIRDDTDICRVVLDFSIGDLEYRISRKRTRKGSSDLLLLERNSVPGSEIEIYHSIQNNIYTPLSDKDSSKKYWKDLSGSRSSDTEKELSKLVKINPKSFRSTIHFVQNDFSGLSTATPEKRKGILKDAFNLLIYTKLEKLAKDKSQIISKEIDKSTTILNTLGDPIKDIISIQSQLSQVEIELSTKQNELSIVNDNLNEQNTVINDLITLHSNLEGKFTDLLSQEKSLLAEKSKTEILVKEYQSKKTNVAKAAKELIEEINTLKDLQSKLANIDYGQIDILTEAISNIKEDVAQLNITIKTSMETYEDYKIPLPTGNICKGCRKPMTDKERQEHQTHIHQEMIKCQKIIQDSKQQINKSNIEITKHQQSINSLSLSKQQLEAVNTTISSKNKEVLDKKSFYEEYNRLSEKFTSELLEVNSKLELIKEQLTNSVMEQANNTYQQIDLEKQKIATINSQILLLNKEITHYNSSKAVLQHTLNQRSKDQVSYNELQSKLVSLNAKYSIYPLVIQGFSSTGIPNLIIQNILDDLQRETNNLLSQLRPGGKEIQLTFSIEKKVEKTGEAADTLDINYQINGRNRYYEQLSGAQQIAVMFSLKLGLSFLLQNLIGTDVRMLLLDEIDQSFDPTSVDEYADIVKFFQKDFVILVITHNDRLKDKFSHAILVEQDINMVSKASVVSSW